MKIQERRIRISWTEYMVKKKKNTVTASRVISDLGKGHTDGKWEEVDLYHEEIEIFPFL